MDAKEVPDFDDKKSWQLVLTANIHYSDKAGTKAQNLMEILLAGGELKLPNEGDPKTKIGTVFKYQSLKDKNLTGKTISFFNDKPIFKIWGPKNAVRQMVAIRLYKKWIMHDIGGDVLRTLYMKKNSNGSVTHIYFEFSAPNKRPYAYIFLENPDNPLVDKSR